MKVITKSFSFPTTQFSAPESPVVARLTFTKHTQSVRSLQRVSYIRTRTRPFGFGRLNVKVELCAHFSNRGDLLACRCPHSSFRSSRSLFMTKRSTSASVTRIDARGRSLTVAHWRLSGGCGVGTAVLMWLFRSLWNTRLRPPFPFSWHHLRQRKFVVNDRLAGFPRDARADQ